MWTAAASAFEPPALRRRAWLGRVAATGWALAGAPFGARAAEPWRVGLSVPLSGEQAALGKAVLLGTQAALAGAQWRGKPLDVLALDDAGQEAQALKNAQQLAADPQVLALLGGPGSAAALAMLPALEAGRLPLLGPITGSEALRALASPWVFPVRAGLQEEAARIVNQLDHQGLNDMAVVVAADAWSREAEAAVQLEMNRAVMRPVVSQRLAPDLGNWEAVLAKVAEGQPHALIVVAPTRVAAAFIRRWNANGFRANVAVFSETGQGLYALLGEGARGVAVCQVMPSPWRAGRPLVRDYQAALRHALAGAMPPAPAAVPAQMYSHASLEGYVNAQLLLRALQLAGAPTREAVLGALQHGSFELDGGPLKFGTALPRRGSRFCEMTLIGPDGVMRS